MHNIIRNEQKAIECSKRLVYYYSHLFFLIRLHIICALNATYSEHLTCPFFFARSCCLDPLSVHNSYPRRFRHSIEPNVSSNFSRTINEISLRYYLVIQTSV